MVENETNLQPYISKYSGEEIDIVLDKAEQLYKLLYDSIPDSQLYFLISKNNNLEWDMIPEIEGVEM